VGGEKEVGEGRRGGAKEGGREGGGGWEGGDDKACLGKLCNGVCTLCRFKEMREYPISSMLFEQCPWLAEISAAYVQKAGKGELSD
jgi:hypothetical protein